MARSIKFPGCNIEMIPPERGVWVRGMHGFANGTTIVTCWKLSPEEIEEISRDGKVYLAVMGNLHPPVFVGSESDTRSMTADYGLWKKSTTS